MMNPDETPQSTPAATSVNAECRNNRARPLLYLIGGIVLVIGIAKLMGWESHGPHTQFYAGASIALGILAFWLGHRPFDSASRWGTILWGTIATLALSTTSLTSLSTLWTPKLGVLSMQLLGVVSIPTIAFRQRLVTELSDRVQSATSNSVKD